MARKKATQLVFEGIRDIPTIGISTINLEENEVKMEITHALRTINQGNFAEIEQGMKEKFFDQGWRLFATHYVGNDPAAGVMILYIFIRGQ